MNRFHPRLKQLIGINDLSAAGSYVLQQKVQMPIELPSKYGVGESDILADLVVLPPIEKKKEIVFVHCQQVNDAARASNRSGVSFEQTGALRETFTFDWSGQSYSGRSAENLNVNSGDITAELLSSNALRNDESHYFFCFRQADATASIFRCTARSTLIGSTFTPVVPNWNGMPPVWMIFLR